MSANFTPERGNFTELKPFRYWCQKILPLVYDDSLSYYELLCKVVDYLNKSMEDIETLNDDMTGLYTAYSELQDYVNHYFDTLDVSEEINAKLDKMAANGSLLNIIRPTIVSTTSGWITENISQETGYVIDKSLLIEDAAADSKAVGERATQLQDELYWSEKELNADFWEKGGFATDGTGDTDYRKNCRCRFKHELIFYNGIHIKSKDSAHYRVYGYKVVNGVYTETVAGGEIDYAPGDNIRIYLDGDYGNDSPSLMSVSEILANFTITEKVLTRKEISDTFVTPTSILTNGMFEHGNIDVVGAEDDYLSNARIRSIFLYATERIMVRLKRETYQDAEMSIAFYSPYKTFKSSSGWVTGYVIPRGSIFRVLLTLDKTSNTYVTTANIFASFDFVDYNWMTENTSNIIVDSSNLGYIKYLFEQGSVHNGVNDTWGFSNRARNYNILECKYPIHVKYHSGNFCVSYYKNGAWWYETGWYSNDIVIDANTQFRMIVTPDFHDVATATAVNTILNGIDFEIMDKYQYGADPNIIFQARNVDDTVYPPYSKWYIKAAAENQYDRVRFNVRITSDGEYVLIHNNTINAEARNSDGTQLSETVNSYGNTYATLNSYDWGIKYGAKYAGYGVPTLEEACKYAALFNLGVTIETSFIPTLTEKTEIAEILAKYSLLENCIMIVANSQLTGMSDWMDIAPCISPMVGGDISYLTTNLSNIQALKTDFNEIYIGVLPWGEIADDSYREFCLANGFKMWCSTVMDIDDLFNEVGFDKGYNLIEANNVYMIKDTVRKYALDELES